MICQNCQQAEANNFFTLVMGGETSQQHFCDNCAPAVMILSGFPHPDALKSRGRAKYQFKLKLSPDSRRPKLLRLPARVSIEDLAKNLYIESYQVIGLLLEIEDWSRPDDAIEFKSAAHVCKRCGVMTVETRDDDVHKT